MKAIGLVPGTKSLSLVDRPEPLVTALDEIKLQVLRVGICGTDREEVAGGRARAPENQHDLIIGHELLGRVLQTGPGVTRVKPGDYAVFTVRRGCGKCLPCTMNRSDMCRTGEYRERGIWGLDGYQSQFVVDKEQYVVRVPSELEPVGVLTEPLSIVEKAIDEAVHLQKARLPDANATPNWLFDRRCLVAGLGPIGLLATLVLRLRGAQVFGLDIVDANTARPQWLEAVGGQYIDGRQLPLSKVNDALGSMELIFEATGVASVVFDLLDALTTDGVFVLAGIPDHDRLLQLDAPGLMRRLVLNNQVMVGSVNAARDHFQMAVADLTAARFRWGDHVAKLITHHSPYTDLATLSEHPADEIKSVIEWTMA